MEIYRNSITESQRAIWRDYWDSYNQDRYVCGQENGSPIDHRLVIRPGTAAHQAVREVVSRHFAPDVAIWANYQRQYKPHNIHMDAYGSHRAAPTHTIIIPMLQDPRIEVIIFRELCNTNDELQQQIQAWGERITPDTVQSRVSESHDVEQTSRHWKHQQYFVDTLTLDGVFGYNLGDYVLFDTNQLHVSSNWKKYPEYAAADSHKDLVQIHIGTSAPGLPSGTVDMTHTQSQS